MKFELEFPDGKMTGGYTGKTARIYREQFGRDIMVDIAEASAKVFGGYMTAAKLGTIDLENEVQVTGFSIQTLGGEFLERILWAALYSCNDGFPLFDSWLDSIEDYPEMLQYAYIAYGRMIGVTGIVEPEEKTETEGDSKKKSPTRK